MGDAHGLQIDPIAVEHETAMGSFRLAFDEAGERTIPGLFLDDFVPFADEIRRLEAWRRGAVPFGFVPSTTLVAKRDGELVGVCTVRHELHAQLSDAQGHVVLSIRPDQRRQGLGRELLDQARTLLGELGVDPLTLVTTTASAAAFASAAGATRVSTHGPLVTWELPSIPPPRRGLFAWLFDR